MGTLRRAVFLLLCISISNSVLYSQEKEFVLSPELTVVKLNDAAYLHISQLNLGDGKSVGCNGLVYLDGNQCVVIDTPCDDEQSNDLLNFIEDSLKAKVEFVVPTHWHVDCLGGLKAFHNRDIPSYGLNLTKKFAEESGDEPPQIVFDSSLNKRINSKSVELKYFGPGHALDNITVWFPHDKILFGGCMMKATNVNWIGNLSDADLNKWDVTVEKVKENYGDAEIVIPGHAEVGNSEIFDHTVEVVRNHQK